MEIFRYRLKLVNGETLGAIGFPWEPGPGDRTYCNGHLCQIVGVNWDTRVALVEIVQ